MTNEKYQSNLPLVILLGATACVVVAAVVFGMGLVHLLTAWASLAVICILTIGILGVVRWRHSKHCMPINNQEIAGPDTISEAKQPVEILSPAEARQWLDEFLVEQQTEDSQVVR